MYGNLVNLMLVGPAAERFLGSRALLAILFSAAVSAGIAHLLFGIPNTTLLGSSGLVFSLIIINSIAVRRSDSIPLSFIIQGMVWTSKEWHYGESERATTTNQVLRTIQYA
jgi:membrane associated rhomboid family serine protease